MKTLTAIREAGFTLLETTVALVLAGFLASMALSFMHSGVTTATDPLNAMSTPLSLQSIMASIVADYDSSAFYLHDMTQLSNNIVNGNYGLTSAITISKDTSYKFQQTDANTCLKVTLTHNATGQSVTYVFTKQQ